eukprot:CAMPEP_0202910900 /NCGR_PEP_ID=MMETSP1392-20130828/53377_1 /ASSEMBLY_ACC=CAM_ASM_000868 /TAXON_ID=225041 /ORGANISM="Chlamydomonas chlamydogama, Strain SAG 11-48b" /LENGTH=136 /DNA_ID=CAMNT_0049601179 /DNA_START=29 /DNA_END=436 /DNA_ORIENTATION=-
MNSLLRPGPLQQHASVHRKHHQTIKISHAAKLPARLTATSHVLSQQQLRRTPVPCRAKGGLQPTPPPYDDDEDEDAEYEEGEEEDFDDLGEDYDLQEDELNDMVAKMQMGGGATPEELAQLRELQALGLGGAGFMA